MDLSRHDTGRTWAQGIEHSLSESERNAFHEFTQLCNDRQLLHKPPGLDVNDVEDGFVDDATLLRFLRGRSFSVPEAMKQLEEAIAIRVSGSVATAYDEIDISDFESTRNTYPHWSGLRDKRGLPICIFDVARLDSKALQDYGRTRDVKCPEGSTTSIATQRALAFHDYLTRFVLPLCSVARDRPNPEVPVTSAVYLVDASGLSLGQAWKLRNYARDTSQLLATCFPEVIDRVYVLNAPSHYAKIWSVLGKWVDPKTASKLDVVPPDEVHDKLTSIMNIDSIPVQFGGESTFRHGMVVNLGKGMQDTVHWSPELVDHKLPMGPIKWTVNKDGNREALAVGTCGGKKRALSVATIVWQACHND